MGKLETAAAALAFGLFAGAIGGAYTMTLIYGDGPSERIAPSERCPPPPPCEPCPPAPSCPTSVPMVELDEGELAPIEIPSTAELGLPQSALGLAMKGFGREAERCLAEASGTLVLDLTVTASAGLGRIGGLEMVSAESDAARALPCLEEAAKRVQFDWSSGEGKTKLRYPMRLGPGEGTP